MSFYNFVNKGEQEADLYITGDIVDSDDSWLYDYFEQDCTAPKNFKTELERHEGKHINLFIDSYGGSVFAAASIYTMLMQHKGGVTAKISSIAASAASVIAMAADKVLMSPTAMIMIHNPATQIGGDQHDLRHAADILDGIKESIINAYERKTHLSRDKISKLMDKESWFDYNEAKELGFADGILGDEKEENFFNKATLNNIKNQRIAVFNSWRRFKAQEEGEESDDTPNSAPKISRVVIGGEDTRSVTVGDDDVTLTATVYYDNDEEATESVTLLWNSSDSDVVTVSDGVVSIAGTGEATVTVTVEGTDISDDVTFTVNEKEEQEQVENRIRKARYLIAKAKKYEKYYNTV